MKRMVCVLLVLWACLAGCGQQKLENPYRLKSQSYVSRNRFEDTYSEPWIWEKLYDQQGYILGERDNQGNTREYAVDEYGNIIKIVARRDGQIVSELDYRLTLDAQHRIIRSESYEGELLRSIQEFSYDRKGNVTRNFISRIYEDGSATDSELTMEYDRHGNLIREETSWNGSASGYKTLEYDKGRLSRTETYDESGELEEYSDYSWEQETRTETCHSYHADGTLYRLGIINYDEYGNPLEQKVYYSDEYDHPTDDDHTGEMDDIADRMDTWTYEPIARS